MGRPRSDDELVDDARAGDVSAYSELVRRHQQTAFRTAMFITRDATEAEDATQEAFVKAWRALPRFRRGAPLRPWLLTIVANEARNRRIASGRRGQLALRAADAARLSPGESPGPEIGPELLAALMRLREEDRLVIGCRYLLELSEAESAAALGVRPGTVKSRLSRALERLREEVAPDA